MFSVLRNYHQLKKFVSSKGADLFGVADVSAVKADFVLSETVKEKVDKAVCVGVGLSTLVLSEIEQEPTKLYFHHYRTANMFLDQLAFEAARWIQKKGFYALPVPASVIIDWEGQRAHLSHKQIGCLAGIGWIGRNNLLVSEQFGAQFRMATILTDMNLKTDHPLTRDCRDCGRCIEVCPVGAIQKQAKDFKHILCFEKLKSFQKQNIVGQFICGICVKACRGKNG